MTIPTDPVSAIISLIPLAVTTVEGVEQLIAELTNHKRTLQEAAVERKAADDQFDADLAKPE